MHFTLNVARFPVNTSPLSELLHLFMMTSRCCCNSASAFIIWGRKGGGGEWLSEMDSNDNQICLHMKQLFPIFPICAFPWVQSSARRVMWRCSEILGFQLHPLSLLLSTAATSTANLLSIIFCQIEFELQTKKRFGLKTLNTLQDNIFNISTQWCQFTYFNHVTAERLSVTTWV